MGYKTTLFPICVSNFTEKMPYETTPPKRTKLATNIRFLRVYWQDKPRREVARYLEVSEKDIAEFECCAKEPTTEQIYKLATYFNVEAQHLLEIDLLDLSIKSKLHGKDWRTNLLEEITEIPDKMKTIFNLREQIKLKDEIIKEQKERIKVLTDSLKLKQFILSLTELK